MVLTVDGFSGQLALRFFQLAMSCSRAKTNSFGDLLRNDRCGRISL